MTNDLKTPDAALKRRHAAETRFRWSGRIAILISLGFLMLMVGSIAWSGKGVLLQTEMSLQIDLSAENVDPANIKRANFDGLVKDALKARFPEVTKRRDKRSLYGLVSSDAGLQIRAEVIENPGLLGDTKTFWVTASDDVDLVLKGKVDTTLEESLRKMNDMELGWVEDLKAGEELERRFNKAFFLSGDSREPELAGIFSALLGSTLSLLVCFALSFPIGILSAIYLEEFAPKNRISDFIEVNINNLAAVPSIVFGLLGLSILLNTFGLPRSTPLVGGMVLSLMTLPTIIIAARASLRAVPPSIREAALGMGASPIQTTFHHVAPLAMPGILTGTIVGMAQALGETAPLLMIGMVAFIVDIPTSVLDAATALPVQIFLWADSPERAFLERTSAAIIVLLVFLVLMNIIAILLRRKFEKRF